jgi:gluconokinase
MSNPHLEHSGLALLDALFHGKPMSFPLRSASATVGGLYVFGRILDKIRLDSQGLLPAGYHLGIIAGKKTFDDRVCRFLGLDFEALRARTLSGGSDEEILDWCYENGRRPDDEQIEVWNAFMQKRGWNDSATSGLQQQKADAGLSHRDDIQTFFALFDAEEGRA